MSNDSLFVVKTKRHDFVMFFVEVIQMDLVQIGKFIAKLRLFVFTINGESLDIALFTLLST